MLIIEYVIQFIFTVIGAVIGLYVYHKFIDRRRLD